jgi:hypothetical protein
MAYKRPVPPPSPAHTTPSKLALHPPTTICAAPSTTTTGPPPPVELSPRAASVQGEHGDEIPSSPSPCCPIPRLPPWPGPPVPLPGRPATAQPHPPLSVLTRARGGRRPLGQKPPCLLSFSQKPLPLFSLSLFSFQIAPRLIINYRLNTVKP